MQTAWKAACNFFSLSAVNANLAEWTALEADAADGEDDMEPKEQPWRLNTEKGEESFSTLLLMLRVLVVCAIVCFPFVYFCCRCYL